MTAAEIAELLNRQMGLAIKQDTAQALSAYLELLLRWNLRINFTSIRDPEQIVLRHFGESLFCAQHLPDEAGATVLDYGSGAGFPGMLCALARPELRVTLAESQQKKAAFLREVARTLQLSVAVHDGRVQSLPADVRFAAITLRAVDRMELACAEAQTRLAPRGRMLVLTTLDRAEQLQSSTPGMDWDLSHRVPAGEARILAVGLQRQ